MNKFVRGIFQNIFYYRDIVVFVQKRNILSGQVHMNTEFVLFFIFGGTDSKGYTENICKREFAIISQD